MEELQLEHIANQLFKIIDLFLSKLLFLKNYATRMDSSIVDSDHVKCALVQFNQ